MRPRRRTAGEEWSSVGAGRHRFSWRGVLWMLLYPQRNQRSGLTLSGLLVIALAMAIGMAAYNSASNILFLTLSLVLGCIILSGVLAWINFRGLHWRLEIEPPWRAGHEQVVALVVRNGKGFLPSYALTFEVRLESTGDVRELPLRERLDPGAEIRLETTLRPRRRGEDRVELVAIGSLFPFGFLRKGIPIGAEETVIVWPSPVEYRRHPVPAWQRAAVGESVRRLGQGGDLLSLRRYQSDDSHRQIHWKASARLRQLMVRQTAAETGQGFSLWVDTSMDRWPRPEQFELLCRFAATLAEDLFTAGTLRTASVGRDAPAPIRRLRDLELFLDRLALAQATPAAPRVGAEQAGRSSGLPARSGTNLLVFQPDGARGVVASLHGERAASA
jgi:uncharacterized protein (DUF58 family)